LETQFALEQLWCLDNETKSQKLPTFSLQQQPTIASEAGCLAKRKLCAEYEFYAARDSDSISEIQ